MTPSDLHPKVSGIANAVAELRNASEEHVLRSGRVMRYSFVDPERSGNDLSVGVRFDCDGSMLFEGKVRVRGAFERGRIAFAQSLVSSVEFGLFAIAELDGTDKVDLRMGVLHLEGTTTNRELAKSVVVGTAALMMRRRQETCDGSAGFDPQSPLGAFPSLGYAFYYGSTIEVNDEPLPGNSAPQR